MNAVGGNPHLLERMLKIANDLSAPAQYRFMETVKRRAGELRDVLLKTDRIIKLKKGHVDFWPTVSGSPIGFVDGGLADLSMRGSAPFAALVGGYTVTPGERGPKREEFIVLKHLVNELYNGDDKNDGVYEGNQDQFPDIDALKGAARISIETAGAVQLVTNKTDLKWVFLHGPLVHPVSRYTDVLRDGKVQHQFPDFSDSALREFLPAEELPRTDRSRNFIGVYLRQLESLKSCSTKICGIIEREATTPSVYRTLLEELKRDRDLPPEWEMQTEWEVQSRDNDEFEGERITDSLLFRHILKPGEALWPVTMDRNKRRPSDAWPKDVASYITRYPKLRVSYLQVTEWSDPIRLEIFEKDLEEFKETAKLVMHCALLLPQYAFPAGLDIADKFAKIPGWMSRPVNMHTAVQALKRARQDDTDMFDSLLRFFYGSRRDPTSRPAVHRQTNRRRS